MAAILDQDQAVVRVALRQTRQIEFETEIVDHDEHRVRVCQQLRERARRSMQVGQDIVVVDREARAQYRFDDGRTVIGGHQHAAAARGAQGAEGLIKG